MSRPTQKNTRLTRILSLDGGGIRGILPGQVLVSLEKKLQQKSGDPTVRVADYFDFFAGTSTGGILTCALLAPDTQSPPRSRYSAADAVDIYLEHGSEIFSIPFWHKVRTGKGVFEEKFPHEALERTLHKYFGDLRLSELLRPCLISAYDVQRGKPHFFNQYKAVESVRQGNLGYDFYVRDVARATSAAPTYFEVSLVRSLSGVDYPLIDGGVFANNPTLCAYSSARQISFGSRKQLPAAAEMLILSIGTGATNKSYAFDSVKKWGMVEWIRPVIDVMMDGVAKTVDYQLRQIYDAVERPQQYLRIDPTLGDATPDMDNATPRNLNALRSAGIETAEKYDWELEQFADRLINDTID
ncbi:MAG: patatin-like phospholipase family protein [Bernardetiaceae bacterium]